MMTVSVQAFRYDMKYLTRYAIIVIAMINIIKLLKYEIDPVINNTKATNKKKSIYPFIITEELVALFDL